MQSTRKLTTKQIMDGSLAFRVCLRSAITTFVMFVVLGVILLFNCSSYPSCSYYFTNNRFECSDSNGSNYCC